MTDLGQKIFCRVIGSNVYGADTAYSNVVGPVNVGAGTPLAPVNFVAPEVTGSGVEGTDLICADGLWIGTEPITYEYQWYYYVPAGASCTVQQHGAVAHRFSLRRSYIEFLVRHLGRDGSDRLSLSVEAGRHQRRHRLVQLSS